MLNESKETPSNFKFLPVQNKTVFLIWVGSNEALPYIISWLELTTPVDKSIWNQYEMDSQLLIRQKCHNKINRSEKQKIKQWSSFLLISVGEEIQENSTWNSNLAAYGPLKQPMKMERQATPADRCSHSGHLAD